MATDKKISELTVAGALTGTETLEIVQGGANKQTTTQDIADLGGGGGTWGSITGTLSDQTDLQAALDAKQSAAQVLTAISAATIGVQDMFVSAVAMWPRVTNGCAALQQIEMSTSLFNVQALAFDQTTQEFAQFQVVPPRKWNNGTITVVPYWTAASGSGTVRWAVNGGMYRNDDALTVAFGTAQNSDDTLIATNDLHVGPESSAITLAGTGADGNFVAIQIARDPANDTLTADALLLGVSIRFTTDAAIDA